MRLGALHALRREVRRRLKKIDGLLERAERSLSFAGECLEAFAYQDAETDEARLMGKAGARLVAGLAADQRRLRVIADAWLEANSKPTAD